MNFNNYNPYGYNYNPYNQQNMQQPQQQQQPVENVVNYDFNGNYVSSFEQVRNTSYTDKTAVYLDTTNDKVYIKRINEKGVPITQSFGLVEIENTNNIETKSETAQDNIIKNIKEEYDKEIQDLKDKLKSLESDLKSFKKSGGTSNGAVK